MLISKFLDPKNDYAFKQIFGTEKNKDILIHFVNDMLNFTNDHQIKTVQFLKTNQNPDIASKKQSILDVLCIDAKGRQYIVEMQVVKTKGFEKRAQYYAAKAYSGQLNAGDNYNQLREVIFVAITDFVMFPDKKAYKSFHHVLDKETYAHDLKDFSFIFLELPKFNKNIDELANITEKWAYFFKHAAKTKEDDLDKIVGDDIIIKRAYDVLNRFSWDEVEMNTYEAEEKRIRDERAALLQKLDDAREQGLVDGEKKGRLEVAKNMLKSKIEIALIMQCTGLSFDEIHTLQTR